MTEYTREDLNLTVLKHTLETSISDLDEMVEDTDNDRLKRRLKYARQIKQTELKRVKFIIQSEEKM